MLKVAIVGCGKIADSHAEQLQHIPGCEIVGVCDREPLMAQQLKDRFPIKAAFSDAHELLTQARPDVVHITTPPQSHFELARLCLEHGCHIFVEKPFTVNAAQAVDLIRFAEERRLKVTVGNDVQFTPAALRFRDFVKQGYLGGAPVHMESHFCYELRGAYVAALLGDSHHWVRQLPGKWMHNIISHGIVRIAEFMQDDAPKVIAHGFVSPLLCALGEVEIMDELRVIVAAKGGATAYFTFSSRMRPSLHQFRLYGPQNGLVLDDDEQTVTRLRGARFKSYGEKFAPPALYARQNLANLGHNLRLFARRDFHMKSGLRNLIEGFYRSIEQDAPLPISYREIILTTRIMDQVFEQISPAGARPSPRTINPVAEPSKPAASYSVPTATRLVGSETAVPGKNGASKPRRRLVLNADDWGRSRSETDAAWECLALGRLTSVSAMVFMADSERAAQLLQHSPVPVGLHLNLSEAFSGPRVPAELGRRHQRIARFLNLHNYALLLYNPFLRKDFRCVYQAQVEEFLRLYGKPPAHIDGHQHKHLCLNMLLGRVIPKGARVRPRFHFSRNQDKVLNIIYRTVVNRWLAKRYVTTDFFSSLHYCLEENRMAHVAELAEGANVELMTHPGNPKEYAYLRSDEFGELFCGVSPRRLSSAPLDRLAPELVSIQN